MDTDYGPATNHANDPRSDARTDLLDRAHNRIVERLLDGDTYHKVNLRDVFDEEFRKRPNVIYDVLEQIVAGNMEWSRDELIRVVNEFAECHLIDAALEDIEQEEREEAMEEGEPYYGEDA